MLNLKRLQKSEAEVGVESLIKLCGDYPDRPGMKDTPQRVTKAFLEMTSGYEKDPAAILSKRFECTSDEMVVVRGIQFVSLCEHHMLPFTGTADIAYIPNGFVVGLSKLPRLVECFAKRFQIQEGLTMQIAHAMKVAVSQHVGVVLTAKHSCMGCRGVMQPNAEMVTSCMLGAFKENQTTRSEFLSLVK